MVETSFAHLHFEIDIFPDRFKWTIIWYDIGSRRLCMYMVSSSLKSDGMSLWLRWFEIIFPFISITSK